MKELFKIGDKVAVLDDTINGVVADLNGQSVTIEADDGFLLVYDASELVRVAMDQKAYSKYIDIKNDALLEKESSDKKRTPTKRLKSGTHPPLEVDLHIHQLVKTTKGMTNFDMLTLQVETARRQLDFAVRKKIQRVVFIHGVGEGVLQQELTYLFNRYHVSVSQASFQKYGMGATEVYIYQNQ
tara:strand:- start:107352 stop:107903 length:552 start_codon:yes stop_codon:yes gene_type:complete